MKAVLGGAGGFHSPVFVSMGWYGGRALPNFILRILEVGLSVSCALGLLLADGGTLPNGDRGEADGEADAEADGADLPDRPPCLPRRATVLPRLRNTLSSTSALGRCLLAAASAPARLRRRRFRAAAAPPRPLPDDQPPSRM